MRVALGLALIALGGLWTARATDDVPKPSRHKQTPIKLLGPGHDFSGQVWGQPYVPPLLSFKVKSGEPPKGELGALCDIVTEHKGEHITVIVLHCEEGLVMELEGIDLDGGAR